MKSLILLLATLTTFLFIYFIINKLNYLLIENRHRISSLDTEEDCIIWVAAENDSILSVWNSSFTSYSDRHPHITFRFSCGTPKQLLEKLACGSLHVALLFEKHAQNLPCDFSYFQLNIQTAPQHADVIEVQEDIILNNQAVYVVWNKTKPSKRRDRFLFVFENEQCHSTCGYRDY